MALLPVSISIGILTGIWFHITILVPWLTAWVGFAGWSSFYFSGANNAALPKSIAANTAGMVQGAIFFWLWSTYGAGSLILLSVLIGLYCFIMTIEGNIPILSAIPGQFAGAAVFFGNLAIHGALNKGGITEALINTFVCMALGNLFGILSAKLPELFKKKEAA